jgi:hemolysin-activating ACP:hemolysin acyltransferase
MFFRKKDEPKPAAPAAKPAPAPAPAAAAPAPAPAATKPAPAPASSAPAASAATTAAGMPLPSNRELFTTYGAEPKGATAGAAPATQKDPLRAFAHIVTLLMKTPETKGMSLADLEWLVIPALRNQQMVVAEARAKDGPQTAPVGMVLWARVSPAVDARLTRDMSPLPKLDAAEWASGDIAWAIASIGRPEIVNAMLGELMKGPLSGKSIKVRGIADGKVTVRELKLNQAA